MIQIRQQCSPELLEKPFHQAHKGADIHHSGGVISIASKTVYRPHPGILPETGVSPSGGKTRTFPAIWEARHELNRRGLVAVPVKGGSPAMIDLIAWDDRIIYGIAVRRSRGDAGVRDITTRYDPLIRTLQTIRVPPTIEIQLWISTPGSFQVYRVLTGGLMSRSLPYITNREQGMPG